MPAPAGREQPVTISTPPKASHAPAPPDPLQGAPTACELHGTHGSRPVEEPGKCRSSTAPPPTDTSHGTILRYALIDPAYRSTQCAGKADLWVITRFCVWIGSLLFAAFGLFTGYLLPSENVTQNHRARADAMQFRRRPVRPAQPVPAGIADPGQVHPAVRAQPARPLPAGRRHPAMGLDLEPGRMARDLRDRRRLVPAPRQLPECDPAPVTRLMYGSGRRRPIRPLARAPARTSRAERPPRRHRADS